MRYLKSVIFEYIANHYDYLAQKRSKYSSFLIWKAINRYILKKLEYMVEFGPIVVKLNHCWIQFPYCFIKNHSKKS